MNQKIYKLEVYLILLPTSIILIPGLLYMFLVPLGDIIPLVKNGSTLRQMNFIAFQSLTILSATSLYSIWVVSNRYIKDKKQTLSYTKNPYLFISIIIGITISLCAVMEIIYPDHYMKEIFGFNQTQTFFGIYIFGLPVCIPSFHMLIISLMLKKN